MYDELIKRLRNRRICVQQLGTLNDYPLLGEAANAIEELLQKTQQLPRWIPVTEALPESGGSYIVYLRSFKGKTDLGYVIGNLSYPTEMYFNKGQMLWVGENESYNAVLSAVDTENEYHVTHWMPLPEPPKEESYGV